MSLKKVSSTPSRHFHWFGWSSSTVVGEPLLSDDEGQVKAEAKAREILENNVSSNMQDDRLASEPQSKENANSSITDVSPGQAASQTNLDIPQCAAVAVGEEKNPAITESGDTEKSQPEPLISEEDNQNITESEAQWHNISFSDIDPELLSLQPTNEQLQELDL